MSCPWRLIWPESTVPCYTDDVEMTKSEPNSLQPIATIEPNIIMQENQ
jgi:hypothetical protein